MVSERSIMGLTTESRMDEQVNPQRAAAAGTLRSLCCLYASRLTDFTLH